MHRALTVSKILLHGGVSMFPVLVIAIGLVVLAFGKRLPVLGGAVGALVGVGLLHLFNISVTDNLLLALLIPGGLAVLGFIFAGAAKAFVDIVLLVLGALAGAAIVLAFLDLFNINTGLLDWILAVLGGVVGLVLVRRFKEIAMIVLAGLIGGLLVTRGLEVWIPSLAGVVGTLIVIVLAGASIAYQSGFLERRRATANP
jgi:hypothetical protein